MSLTFKSTASAKQLIAFLESEYTIGSGIPVHLFSVVNATFSSYNRSLGITDGAGTIFFESAKQWKSYGNGNPTKMISALACCNVKVKCIG